METSTITAEVVADYLLSLSCPDCGDYISNLKLQKLLYYCQGFHLAMFDKPLFTESILHWEHGPVVPEMYHRYKSNGREIIPIPETVDESVFSPEQKELIQEVFEVYGQYSAWRLRDLTHEEPPYTQTRNNELISLDLMKNYFKTQLKA